MRKNACETYFDPAWKTELKQWKNYQVQNLKGCKKLYLFKEWKKKQITRET